MMRQRRSARRRAGLAVAAVAVCGGVGLSGCGSTAHHAGSSATAPANTVPAAGAGTLRTSPAHPTTRSTITFGFREPVAAGVQGHDLIGYSLSVTGTGGPSCVGAREAGAPAVAQGATATIALGPAQLGRPWCPGAYAARVIELQRPHCGGRAPCPQYIRVVAIVAEGRFTVTRG